MNRKFLLLVPLSSLIIACMTCNTTTTLPSPSTESAATEAVVTEVPATEAPATEAPAKGSDTGDILLYSDDGGEAGSKIDSFPTTQHKLHVKTKVEPLNKGQKVRWVFTALDAGSLQNEEISVLKIDIPTDNVTTVSASLSNDSDWPAGTYKVELYIDGDLLKSGEFEIVEP